MIENKELLKCERERIKEEYIIKKFSFEICIPLYGIPIQNVASLIEV